MEREKKEKRKYFLPLWKRMKPAQWIVLGFFGVIFVGGLLLSLPICSATGQSVGLLNGMFTATTSVCVTGLIVVDTGLAFSHVGHFLILCLIQLGGLGFMTIATVLFRMMRKRITLKQRMLIQESMNQDSLAGMVRLIRNVVSITILIETTGAVLLAFSFVPKFGLKTGVFYSVFIAISAFCNAGLDPLGQFQSLTAYTGDVELNLTVMMLIILGGLGFTVIYDVWKEHRWKKFSLHTKLALSMTAVLVIAGTVLFTLMEWNNPATMGPLPAGEKVLAGAFQSVTTRTAGFNSIDQGAMTNGSFLLTLILMFIGAAPGSTGGGIKVTTFFVLLLTTYSIVCGRQEAVVGKRSLGKDLIRRAAAIAVLAMMLVLLSTLLICVIETNNPQVTLETALYECISALATVGLSCGLTPNLSSSSKLILMFLMFCGRVGPLTITTALANGQKKSAIRYPESRIMIG